MGVPAAGRAVWLKPPVSVTPQEKVLQMNDQVLNSPTVEYPLVVLHHPPWNKNRIIGRKVPFKLREICTIRAYLD
jgi:hypothetical protein